ncbi:unnamed protein product [Peronospora destructor]|uniref:Uncharacterized protein n=1 Tax=Peronospora destructor TaxID=86335 RepID=A0AAV0SYF1_9STRA|nr:unnamed protein product [Peronospora destructor]
MVGPTIGKAGDTACYRKSTAFDSANMCPLGYGKEEDDCIVQCPLAYPVGCTVECLPKNGDCTLNFLAKAGSVIEVVLNAATAGVFGSISKSYKTTKWALMCAKNVYEVIHGIIFYLNYRQTSAPQGDIEQMLTIAYQYREGGDYHAQNSHFDWSKCAELTHWQWIDKKRLTDRVIRAVLKYRNTGAPIDDIRVKVNDSLIVRNDIPIVTNNCMKELLHDKTQTTAYETHDLLRNTFGVIVDQLIDTGRTDNGTNVAEEEYMMEVANMGLLALSALDPTSIAYVASQFVQPLCLPNAYIGEIDDGTLYDALGLQTVDEAFKGSYGSYTHAGDGVIHLIFESVDTKDVNVVIHSGGDEYGKVDVGAGIFGLPGSGGGSLLLWIPRSSEGGHITMHVRINPS